MESSLLVSIFAVLVAAVSLVLALRADRRASRAEARGLRAHIIVEPYAMSSGPAGRRFDIRVRNVGSDVAHEVRIWLENESGRVVSTPTHGSAPALAAGEDPVEIALTVPEAALPPPPVSFSVWMSWSDRAGRHERSASGVSVST
jgi:hypothetical protein